MILVSSSNRISPIFGNLRRIQISNFFLIKLLVFRNNTLSSRKYRKKCRICVNVDFQIRINQIWVMNMITFFFIYSGIKINIKTVFTSFQIHCVQSSKIQILHLIHTGLSKIGKIYFFFQYWPKNYENVLCFSEYTTTTRFLIILTIISNFN